MQWWQLSKVLRLLLFQCQREQGTMGGGIRCEDRGEHTMQGIWENGRQKT